MTGRATRFHDRADAGRALAKALQHHTSAHPLVVGIAPGGMEVAYAIAHALDAPLEAWVVRRIHAPDDVHHHVGAIAEPPNHVAVHPCATCENGSVIEAHEHAELEHQVSRVRRRPREPMRNRTVILVDEGAVTGMTVRAAIRAIRQEKPHRVILALPVATKVAFAAFERFADDCVCLVECEGVQGVRDAYEVLPDADAAGAGDLVEHRHLERASQSPHGRW